MLAPAVTFYTVVLAAHIASVVIAFGVTFAYPLMYAVGLKREPRSMPGFHRIQDYVGKFVISPNSPARQIWISALSTSFKLDWSAKARDFVLAKTGEGMKALVGRLMNEQLGEEAIRLVGE